MLSICGMQFGMWWWMGCLWNLIVLKLGILFERSY